MQEWKLPSQLVTTDNTGNERPEEIMLRHEVTRRVTAEHHLIQVLDFIDAMPKTKENEAFLNKYLDKTINN